MHGRKQEEEEERGDNWEETRKEGEMDEEDGGGVGGLEIEHLRGEADEQRDVQVKGVKTG